jgi:hypothetical protein
VIRGNSYKLKTQERETSELYYQEARKAIVKCLNEPGLRHTWPSPPSHFPPEMLALFAEVRSEIFGAFRIVGLDPADACVTLDGDTLRTMPGDSLLGDLDIPVGLHLITLQRDGFRTVTAEINISPNSTLERDYRLAKARGPWWYVSRIGLPVTAVAALVISAGGGEHEPVDTLSPFPPPPDPPEPQ